MKFRTLAATAAALTLAASPAVAQAERTSAPATKEAEMGGSGGIVLAILAIAAIIAGIIIAADSNDNNGVSP